MADKTIKYLDLDGLKKFWGKAKESIMAMDTVVKDTAVNASNTYTDEKIAEVNGEASALKGRVDTAESKITTLEGKVTTAEGTIADNTKAINGEVKRSTDVDNAFRAELGTKGKEAEEPATIYGRLKKAEDELAQEVTDRTNADTTISNLLGTIHDADTEATAFGKIAAETKRATDAEKVTADLLGAVDDNKEKATAFGKIAAEAARADGVEKSLRKDLGVNDKTDSNAFARIATIEGKIEGLTGAMHFVGKTNNNPETEVVVIEGNPDYKPKAGDVVLYKTKEYIYQETTSVPAGGKWIEFGDEGSLATQDFVNDAVSTETTRATTEEGKIREDYAAADAQIRTDYAAADTSLKGDIEKAYKDDDAQIRTDYAAADAQIRTDYAAADKLINAALGTKSDVATESVDTAFSRIDTNKKSIATLNTNYDALKADVDAMPDARITDDDIAAVFA